MIDVYTDEPVSGPYVASAPFSWVFYGNKQVFSAASQYPKCGHPFGASAKFDWGAHRVGTIYDRAHSPHCPYGHGVDREFNLPETGGIYLSKPSFGTSCLSATPSKLSFLETVFEGEILLNLYWGQPILLIPINYPWQPILRIPSYYPWQPILPIPNNYPCNPHYQSQVTTPATHITNPK